MLRRNVTSKTFLVIYVDTLETARKFNLQLVFTLVSLAVVVVGRRRLKY